jgi:methyl-accepting chemotaxis protein
MTPVGPDFREVPGTQDFRCFANPAKVPSSRKIETRRLPVQAPAARPMCRHGNKARRGKTMNWFYDMKIGAKLIGAFILTGVITAVVGFIGIANMGKIADMSATSYEKETLGIVYLKQTNIELIHMARAEKNLLLSSNAEEREKYKNALSQYSTLANQDLEKARPLIHTEEGKALLTKFDGAWKERQEVVEQILALAAKDRAEQKRASVELSFGLGRQKADAVENVLAQLVDIKENNAKKVADTTAETYHSSRSFMIAMIIGGILVGVGLGVFIARSISRPLGNLADAAKQISLGKCKSECRV